MLLNASLPVVRTNRMSDTESESERALESIAIATSALLIVTIALPQHSLCM